MSMFKPDNLWPPRIDVSGRSYDAAEFLDCIEGLWPKCEEVPKDLPDLISLVEGGVAAFPYSPRMWCRLGDVIQLGANSTMGEYSAFDCYKKALDLDPLCGEAYEEIGFLYDLRDEPGCRAAFELAVRCDGSLESCLAIARLLLEKGAVSEARVWLDTATKWYKSAELRIAEIEARMSGNDELTCLGE